MDPSEGLGANQPGMSVPSGRRGSPYGHQGQIRMAVMAVAIKGPGGPVAKTPCS